jgi:hypothetical protein
MTYVLAESVRAKKIPFPKILYAGNAISVNAGILREYVYLTTTNPVMMAIPALWMTAASAGYAEAKRTRPVYPLINGELIK